MAAQLVLDHFDVVPAGGVRPASVPPEVVSLPDAVADEVRGFVGGFQVDFSTSEGQRRELVDAIVAAQSAAKVPKLRAYGLALRSVSSRCHDWRSCLSRVMPCRSPADLCFMPYSCWAWKESPTRPPSAARSTVWTGCGV